MIAQTIEELTAIIGTRPACRALGASVARPTAGGAHPSRRGRRGRARRRSGR